jgi:hypothetical protein
MTTHVHNPSINNQIPYEPFVDDVVSNILFMINGDEVILANADKK